MLQKIITSLVLIFLPSIILAHGSHGNGIMAGFTHPIYGVDHNVAILGAGFLGYIFDHKKWYLYPMAFISAMIVGGFMGIEQDATFLVEKVIALSVLLIGLTIAFNRHLNIILVLGVLFVFGGFHGYAHGAEMPESTTAIKYITGFTLGAVLLSLVGTFISRVVTAKNYNYITLISGVITGCGIMMLLP